MKKTYSDKLKDPRWQRKRLEILNRDDFTCTLCNDTETELHVHHEKYTGEPWEVNDDKLKTLCRCCHTIIENHKDWTFIKGFKVGNAFVYKVKYEDNSNKIALFYALDLNHLVSFTPNSELIELIYNINFDGE